MTHTIKPAEIHRQYPRPRIIDVLVCGCGITWPRTTQGRREAENHVANHRRSTDTWRSSCHG